MRNEPPVFGNDRDRDRPIRIGYVSGDFKNCSVGRFIRPILANHDRRRFEVFAYAFASKRLTRLSDVGWPWIWLGDGRRLLYSNRGKLFVLDSVSKSSREILSVAPDDFDGVALSPDNRTIYFTRATQQGNIWLMTRDVVR